MEKKSDFDVNDFKYVKFNATKQQLRELERLINKKASETEMHNFLNGNREIFSFALHPYRTGHHGSLILSKQNIKPHLKINSSKGLIPDFLIAGDSSDGHEWWVVELKGVNDKVFVSDNEHTYFSSTANKGIFQLLEYIDFCSEHQTYLKDTIELPNFSAPNGLLIIGDGHEFSDERRRKLKSAWNKLVPKKLEIRSYSWLLRQFKENDSVFKFRNTNDSLG